MTIPIAAPRFAAEPAAAPASPPKGNRFYTYTQKNIMMSFLSTRSTRHFCSKLPRKFYIQ